MISIVWTGRTVHADEATQWWRTQCRSDARASCAGATLRAGGYRR